MTDTLQHGMSVIDFVVFFGLLSSSLLIGAYYGLFKKQSSTADYLVGNRSMPVLPTAISLLASYVSAILILGIPAELFYHGSLLWESLYAYIIVFPLAAYIFIPTFYNLNLTSVYEYLELRFDSRLVRLLATITFGLQSTMYLGVVVFAPSIALQTVAGFPHWASILCIGGVGTLYTAVGGLRAVVWTDVLQCVLMFGGLLAIIIEGSIQLGGLDEAFRITNDWNRLQFFDFNPSPFIRHTTLTCVIGHVFIALSMYGCQQTSVQRYCSMGSVREAVWSLLLNIPLLVIIVSLGWIAGIVVFASYATCDPLTAGYIHTKDAVVPYFVLHRFTALPGMLGLFVTSLLSGALSSVSSLLNALAAVAWEDFLSKTDFFRKKGESVKLAVTKILGFMFGGITIGMAFLLGNQTGLIQTTASVNGAVNGPLLGVFLLALFLPWGNKYGAVAGMLSGLVCSMWLSFGAVSLGVKPSFLPLATDGCDKNSSVWLSSHASNDSIALHKAGQSLAYNVTDASNFRHETEFDWPEKLFTISYLYYCMIGCCVTVLIGGLVSLLTGSCTSLDVPPEMLHPLVRRYATAGSKIFSSSLSSTPAAHNINQHTDKVRPKTPDAKWLQTQEYIQARYRYTGDDATSAL